MIRCPTIDREMPVKRCLEYQRPRIGEDSWNKGELTVYPCCTGCRTGELLRLGKKDEAIQSAEKEEKQMEIKKKQCSRCRKVKPLEEFCRDKKAVDGHRSICLECNRAYQNNWAADKREKEEKAHPERLESSERTPQTGSGSEPPLAPAAIPQDEQTVTEDARLESSTVRNAPSHQLLLDFSCYPEVLKEIKRLAHHAERPVEVQARFMLKVMLMDGWSEDMRAAGGRCPVPLPNYESMLLYGVPGSPGTDAVGRPGL